MEDLKELLSEFESDLINETLTNDDVSKFIEDAYGIIEIMEQNLIIANERENHEVN